MSERDPKKFRSDFEKLTGQKFNRLLVIQYGYFKNKHHYWICLCDCGEVKEVPATSLKSSHTMSCGCYKLEFNKAQLTTHGLSYTRGYKVYKCAKRRAEKAQRTPKWLTDWDWQMIKEIYQFCPPNFEVDHIIPLNGKNVSGLHVPENLQYLYKPIHMPKSNKFEPIYEQS